MNELCHSVIRDTNKSCGQESGGQSVRKGGVGLQLDAGRQMVVQLYKGFMKVYMIQTNVSEGSSTKVVEVEHKDEVQATGLEITEPFILCGYKAYKTHIKKHSCVRA
jgi:hypothetical protein